MEILKKSLLNIGLSDKEAETYLSLVQLKEASVSQISKKSGLLRTTTHEVLKSLIKKGFVSFFKKNHVTHYVAADCSIILDSMEQKCYAFKKNLSLFKEFKNKPVKHFEVEHFEGKEGLRNILKDFLNDNKEPVLIFGNFEGYDSIFKYDGRKYVKERIKKNIPVKIICEKSPSSIRSKSYSKKELRSVDFLESFKGLKSEIFIYKNKVALLSYLEDNLNGVIIENKEITDLMKVIFKEFRKKSTKK